MTRGLPRAALVVLAMSIAAPGCRCAQLPPKTYYACEAGRVCPEGLVCDGAHCVEPADYYEAVEVSCDGKDNDYDGFVDNIPQCVSTVAGGGPPGFADGPLRAARFDAPSRVLSLPDGTLYVSDSGNNLIRRVDLANGSVTTVAGTPRDCGDPEPQGKAYEDPRYLCNPNGMAWGPDGKVYIVDTGHQAIRSLVNGVLGLVVGNGTPASVDGTFANAQFNYPFDVAISGSILFVTDLGTCTIRSVDLDKHEVSTIAGSVCGPPLDGPGARFGQLRGIAVDGERIFVSEEYWAESTKSYSEIRIVDRSSGEAHIIAGGDQAGYGDGEGAMARFQRPAGLLFSSDGLYVADGANDRLRVVSSDQSGKWSVGTKAGSDRSYTADGPALQAGLDFPVGLALHQDEIFFVDTNGGRLRKINTAGEVVTVAGGPSHAWEDGNGALAALHHPDSIAFDPVSGSAFFTEPATALIRELRPDGSVVTLAGQAGQGFKDGTLAEAMFSLPNGIAMLGTSRLVIADSGNRVIRLLDREKKLVTTLAGQVQSQSYLSCLVPGAASVEALDFQFSWPVGVAVGSAEVVYIADQLSHAILKLANGKITIFAGKACESGAQDGQGSQARFSTPWSLAVGPDDSLYVADFGNNLIRAIDPTGNVTTYAGTTVPMSPCQAVDSEHPTEARFCFMGRLAFLGSDLFIVDTSGAGDRVRRVTAQGVTTVAGGSGGHGWTDGDAKQALFNSAAALCPAPGGGLYVTDYFNNRIRRVMP